MTEPIGILGCGWLGEPLARILVRDGRSVRGTTTREEKRSELARQGIDAYRIRLTAAGFEGPIDAFLSGLGTLVFNIPPGFRSSSGDSYPQKIKNLDQVMREHACNRLLYVSSTSVYGSRQGVVDDSTVPRPDSQSGKELRGAEEFLLHAHDRNTLVIRFGGLIGGSRHPAKYLSGRTGLEGGGEPVNLIHQEDCLRILLAGLADPGWIGVLNAVHPDHPLKSTYYPRAAEKLGVAPPTYAPSDPVGDAKVVASNHPLLQPKAMLRDLLDI